MRKHLSLFLTASFLFLSQNVQGSPINTNDDSFNGAQNAGVLQGASNASSATSSTSSDLQCYRRINGKLEPLFDDAGTWLDRRAQEASSETMSSVEKDGKLLWTNILSGLAHHVRVAVMECLQDDPRGQLSLMTVSHGFRRLALVLPQRYNDAVSTGNDLKKHLFIVLIGGQTGDLDLFMKDGQLKAFQTQSLQDLQDAYASRYYNGTLSPTTKHGKTYRSIGQGDSESGFGGQPFLILDSRHLRLVPLNFPAASTIASLRLDSNQLKVLPDLSHLTKLQQLTLSHNQLRSVPDLSPLTELWGLNLENNQLMEVSGLSHLTKLVNLHLSNNPLRSVPDLLHFTNLEWLTLSNNQMTVVQDLSYLTKLQQLTLSHNRLMEVSGLSHLTKLWDLNLENNQLNSAPDLSRLRKLLNLDLSNNPLRSLPNLSHLTKLWDLRLENNQLTSVQDLSHLTNLRQLFLSTNPLSALPGLSKLKKLEAIYLDAALCQDETVIESLRLVNRSRANRDWVKLIACSKDPQGNDVQEEVPLD